MSIAESLDPAMLGGVLYMIIISILHPRVVFAFSLCYHCSIREYKTKGRDEYAEELG
jgi:hypothetical protein